MCKLFIYCTGIYSEERRKIIKYIRVVIYGAGSSVDEIIKVYGNNYYKRMSDIGVSVIGYVDKDRKINLEFSNYENTVVMIRYDINAK
jgi:hypothetical protein